LVLTCHLFRHKAGEDSHPEVVRRQLKLLSSVLTRCRYTVYKDHITLADYEINDGA